MPIAAGRYPKMCGSGRRFSRSRLLAIALVVLLVSGPRSATAAASAESHLLVISGLGGEARYADAFHEWAISFIDTAWDSGLSADNVTFLAESPTRDPQRIGNRSTKANIETALDDIADRAAPGDLVYVLIFGHGSYQAGSAHINLPGPDMDGADFARLLERFSAQRLVVINTASASGDFIRFLSGPNRAVIAATQNSAERNQTVFGGYFVEAFASDGADVDKNGSISLLEGFEYARREVERFYDRERRLLTEHAVLDDNGDQKGSRQPSAMADGDGGLASSIFLSSRSATVAAGIPGSRPGDPGSDAPELFPLLDQRRILEEKISALRQRKSAMQQEAYLAELEDLLIELAVLDRRLRQRDSPPP